MWRLTTLLTFAGILTMIPSFSNAAEAGTRDDKLTIVNPETLPDPSDYGYSVSVIAPAGARVAFISGQGGAGENGVYSPEFSVQVKQAYANLGKVLDALGAKPNQVAKLTVFVVDHDSAKLGVLTQSVRSLFGEALPSQTLVPVPRLAIEPMLFEVEAVVILPRQ